MNAFLRDMIGLSNNPQSQAAASNLRPEPVSSSSPLVNQCLTLGSAIFLAFGVALRTRSLLFNAPFYQDEASLARNMEDRTFPPLWSNSAAPAIRSLSRSSDRWSRRKTGPESSFTGASGSICTKSRSGCTGAAA
jgi:hypothetical protein